MMMSGRCAPHFLFETSKRKCAAPGGKENMFGGSVCAGADLLPPAGEGWQSRAAVRDGNARPLGNPSARGCPGYIQLLFSLPLAVVDESLRSGPMRASAPTGRAELAPNTCIPGPRFGSSAVDNDSARTKGGNSCHPGKYSAAGSGRKSRIPVRLQFHIYTSLSPKTILCKKCIKCNMQFLHDIC